MTQVTKFDLAQVHIESASQSDEAPISMFFERMLVDTFQQNDIWEMQELLQEEIEEKKHFLNEALKQPNSRRQFMIAKYRGQVVGTIASGPANKDIIEGTNGACEGWLEIGTVFVDPMYQGMGLGNLMIDHIENWLREQGINQYSLDSGYKKAQVVWTKKYGEPTVLLKDHWAEGADHMIWCVNL